MKQLNPKNFINYDEHKVDLEDKLFLFNDKIPKGKITYDEKEYSLDEPIDVNLAGQVTDPARAISRSLLNSYEWVLLKTHQARGFLFVYVDFAPGSDSDSKQLEYKVYPLI